MRTIFELEMKVRDYECDVQGVVNNANYQHYFENARHEYLESKGASFSALHEQGMDVMVARMDITYKYALRGSDRFVIRLDLKRAGVKLLVFHDLYRLPDMLLCTEGRAELIAVENGRITRGEFFDQLFAEELKER